MVHSCAYLTFKSVLWVPNSKCLVIFSSKTIPLAEIPEILEKKIGRILPID